MSDIPTPHINAKKDDFADTVLMPGDPLRAKYIAETYLTDAKMVTDVRNILGYTGSYEGKRISVMASGMGMPSMGIYSYELFKFYDVQNIIRIGSAGSIRSDVKLKDIIIAEGACSTSNWCSIYHLDGTFAPIASWNLLYKAVRTAEELNQKVVVGNVLSEDVFYAEDPEYVEKWKKLGVIALEMESAALYANAARTGKQALAMFSVSDEILTGESLSSKEREVGFSKMMELALKMS